MRVSLADAARITGRQEATIRGWILTKQLTDYEARHTGPTGVRLRVWSIDVDAIERVHRAHGGVYWNPEVLQRVRLPSILLSDCIIWNNWKPRWSGCGVWCSDGTTQ